MSDKAIETTPGQSGSGSKKPGFVPTAPPSTLATGSAAQSTSTSRGVWYLRPQQVQPYYTSGSVGQTVSLLANPSSVYNNPESAYNSQYYDASDLEGAYSMLDANQKRFFELVAKSDSSRSTGSGLFGRLLKEAQRLNVNGDEQVSPFDLVGQMAVGNGLITEDGNYTESGKKLAAKVFGSDGSSGSRGSGGYSGPVAQTTFMDERDVDRTANALALELIGRPLSQKELAKVTARLRSEEKANPTVTTPGVGSSMTQAGLSAEGRQDVLREVIAENPEYQQFQVDTTVLDTMLSELNKREQMVNGR